MLRGMLLLLPVFAVFCQEAEDPWKQVRDLKTGTEVRIFKAGAPKAIMAQFADLTDENLVVILKNEQVAIPKDKVTRIDWRPPKGYVTTQTKVSGVSDAYVGSQPVPPGRSPGTSTSTGVAIGEKAEFATIYRRPAPASPTKK